MKKELAVLRKYPKSLCYPFCTPFKGLSRSDWGIGGLRKLERNHITYISSNYCTIVFSKRIRADSYFKKENCRCSNL